MEIDPKKFYNANEILLNGIFPWAKSLGTVRKWIERDMKGENRMKAVKIGKNTGTRYLILGSNLINYLVNFEDGNLKFSQKEK